MAESNKKYNTSEIKMALSDLIDVKSWQRIQDNFSQVTNVCVRTVDSEGLPVTAPSGEPRLCTELLSGSPVKSKICAFCLPTFLGGKGIVDKNLSYSCISGLTNFLTPLRVDDKVVGYLIIGPVILGMRKSKEQYLKLAEDLNLDVEDLWSAIVELKVVSQQGAQSLVEFIKDIADYVLKLAYTNMQMRKEVGMFESARLSRIWDALLDVAVQVSGADTGSVMFFDKVRDVLTIRAAKGLSDEVVRNTKVRMGEGISGTAAKEKMSFLINENEADNRIKNYLKRPQIKSAMVVPIQAENTVLGVMNLGSSEPKAGTFDADSMKLIGRLIDLATVSFHE
ncbi:MAG: PocR ligand-binding domain-containing protein [Candidatus Omnitrophica bacterium]|nr:PocR ligand-binding domain-containing protein [Candidatus Omnitrophota bacterium]